MKGIVFMSLFWRFYNNSITNNAVALNNFLGEE